jgi:hypothetical protein
MEDALPVFFNEHFELINGDIGAATFQDFFHFIHKKPIDGMFLVRDMEEKYNELLEKKKRVHAFL